MPAPRLEAEPVVSRTAVFGYGSLVSATSAAQTLGRPVTAAPPTMLRGYRRAWTLARDNERSEKTFALADGRRPRHCLGLNLEPDAGAPAVNGTLIEVAPAELERLDLRELRYRRVEVADAIAGDAAAGFDAVFAYVARPQHHHPTPPADSILIAGYLKAVERAFDELGPGQLETFRATTAALPVEVVEATLVEDRIPPGNPRGW